jgi:hypothetical protein
MQLRHPSGERSLLANGPTHARRNSRKKDSSNFFRFCSISGGRTSGECTRWNPRALDWERNLLEAAIVRVKKRVNAKQYQMFNLYVMMKWRMDQVKKTLGVSAAQVYMAKMRIGRMIKREVGALEKTIR